MDSLEILKSVVSDKVLDSLRKNSSTFNAIDRLYGYLHLAAEKRISPDSIEGKKLTIDMETAIADFNSAFIKHGLNPNMALDWNLC